MRELILASIVAALVVAITEVVWMLKGTVGPGTALFMIAFAFVIVVTLARSLLKH